MTTRPGRLRRAKEWLWRGQRLRELQGRTWRPDQRRSLEEAKSCHKLAWRVLAGLEPVPAATREAVAQPLLVAGVRKCLPLLEPSAAGLAELFDDAAWQARFASAGIAADGQPLVQRYLLEPLDSSPTGVVGQQALLALGALIDALELEVRATRRLLWRRVRVLITVLLLLGGIATGIVLWVAPPEGPDLGVGKPWQSSSFYPGFAVSGVKPSKTPEGAFFSTNDEVNPWWKLDLQAPVLLGNVTVVNRGECCPDRAIPLVLELSTDGEHWREVARRTQTFRTWSPSFKATKARYVRLRALRRTFLHLKDVRVHAPR